MCGERLNSLRDDESLADSPADSRHRRLDPEFLQDPVAVARGRFEADSQSVCDRFGVESVGEEAQHLDLAPGQPAQHSYFLTLFRGGFDHSTPDCGRNMFRPA